MAPIDSINFTDEELEILAITPRDMAIHLKKRSPVSERKCQVCGGGRWQGLLEAPDQLMLVQQPFVRRPKTGSWTFQLVCTNCGAICAMGVDAVLETARDIKRNAERHMDNVGRNEER